MHATQRRAEKHYRPLLPIIAEIAQNDIPYAEIAKRLNARGLTTFRGTPFTKATVFLLLKRSKLASA